MKQKCIILTFLFSITLFIMGSCEAILHESDGTYVGHLRGTNLSGNFRIIVDNTEVSGYVYTNIHKTFDISGSYTDEVLKFTSANESNEEIYTSSFIGIIEKNDTMSGTFIIDVYRGSFSGSKY